MKKILSVNIGSKRFAEEFNAECKKVGIDSIKVRARNCCIILANGRAELYQLGEKINISDILYAFIRVRGEYPLMTSLLCLLFESEGIPFNDRHNKDHTLGDEKITQMLALTLAGIPIPKTALFTLRGFEANKDVVLNGVSYPLVLKTNGAQGKAVWKVDNEKELLDCISRIEEENEVAMIQEFIPNRYDIRVLALFGNCIGAIKRESADGFYNNVSRGGRATEIKITDEERELSLRACKLLGRDFGGVDIVRTRKGSILFEVNACPQIYGFENATNINVAKELVERIDEKTRTI